MPTLSLIFQAIRVLRRDGICAANTFTLRLGTRGPGGAGVGTFVLLHLKQRLQSRSKSPGTSTFFCHSQKSATRRTSEKRL